MCLLFRETLHLRTRNPQRSKAYATHPHLRKELKQEKKIKEERKKKGGGGGEEEEEEKEKKKKRKKEEKRKNKKGQKSAFFSTPTFYCHAWLLK